MNIQPVIHDYLAQIFVKHYKLDPKKAAEQSLRFYEIVQLYGLEIIVGEWLVPEPVPVVPAKPKDAWTRAIEALQEAEEREPWLAREIQ